MLRSLLLMLIILLTPIPAHAQESRTGAINLSEWSSLPILHEGRVKPLNSFARIYLKTFSGKDYIDNLNAIEWLAEALFTPEIAVDRPIFKIRDTKAYGLIETKNKLYSYLDLSNIIQNKQGVIQKLIEQPEKNWTSNQNNLMALYQNFILYTQILRSFTLLLPLALDVQITGEYNKENISFLTSKNLQKSLKNKAKKIVRRKGTDLDKYTDEEKNIAALSFQLQALENGGKNNVLLRLIPLDNTNKNTNWASPWSLTQSGNTSPNSLKSLKLWQNLANAYREDNNQAWLKTLHELQPPTFTSKLKIETLYNNLHLLLISGALYALSFFALIFSRLLAQKHIQKTLLSVAYGSLLLGLVFHTIHIALRIYILDRPPVGTLYESILFVSIICVAGCAFLEHNQKNQIGILLGSLSGILLLSTATAFASEDTMSTLVAVLNTNFWLTIHVLCITIGYGWCLIASFLAHIYLGLSLIKSNAKDQLDLIKQNLKILLILSLLFTVVGTILGGIWADQSWGRFWGWDPKENGALLIVLWLIWILHSRISKHISETGLVIGTAFLSVIVTIAWFGVNLLNVGLHSYGFITSIAWGIGLFCAFETIIIGGAGLALHCKEKRLSNEN